MHSCTKWCTDASKIFNRILDRTHRSVRFWRLHHIHLLTLSGVKFWSPQIDYIFIELRWVKVSKIGRFQSNRQFSVTMPRQLKLHDRVEGKRLEIRNLTGVTFSTKWSTEVDQPCGRPRTIFRPHVVLSDIGHSTALWRRQCTDSHFASTILQPRSFQSISYFYHCNNEKRIKLLALACIQTEVSCGQTIYDECDGCKLAYRRDCISVHTCSGFSFSPLEADLGTGTAISEVSFDSPRPSSLFEAGTLASTSSSTELTLHREPVIVQRAKLKRRFVEKKPSERETVKSYYINKADQRYDANIIKLSTVLMTGHASWVWQHFKRFDLKAHPDMKELVSCNLCYQAALACADICFTIPYPVCIRR